MMATDAAAGPGKEEAQEGAMPELNSLAIATVKKIMPYGAFCTLDEYGNREAFIHVSEVASRWVKNIHEFLKEGQKIVARVHRLTPEKNQVDLSLRRVTDADKKLKMENYKREKRATKLFELCAKKAKVDPAKAWEGVGKELIDKYGDIYSALEKISFDEGAVFKEFTLTPEWKKALMEVAKANIHKPEVLITETVSVRSFAPDAIDCIKEAFRAAVGTAKGTSEVKVHYVGAPHYRLSVKAEEYKTAEKVLEEANAQITNRLKGAGTVEFERQGAA